MRLKGLALLSDYDAPMWLIWEMWVDTDRRQVSRSRIELDQALGHVTYYLTTRPKAAGYRGLRDANHVRDLASGQPLEGQLANRLVGNAYPGASAF